MSDSVSQNTNSPGFTGLEEDSGVELTGQESAFARENAFGKAIHIVDSVVTSFSAKLEIEKAQAYLFCVFFFFLIIVQICIYLAWNYYSPIIVRFFEKDERLKRAAEKEKRPIWAGEHTKSLSQIGPRNLFSRKMGKGRIMDKIKAFIKGKKVDKHFKHSGKGVRLSEASSSNSPSIVSGSDQGASVDRVAASDVAAQAALKRLFKEEPKISSSQKRIQMIAQRELEEERRQQDPAYAMQQMGIQHQREPDVREFEHSGAISGVFYTCEMLGEDTMMTKPDLMKTLEDFLIEQLEENDEAVTPAVLLIYSLNTASTRNTAVETIAKYLQNILENPEDPKYWKIRIGNKAIQERVFSCKGGREFLVAVGFSEQMLSPKEGDPAEPFLVMSGETAENSGALISALEALREGHSIPIKVARNPSIFILGENQKVVVPKVSADFFDLTADEVKKEQQAKTDEVNRMLSLRTKEMRERDEKLRQYKYKYTLIRIRLPDRFVIQGTFGCYEPVSTVREFIASLLSDASGGVPWTLKDPMNGKDVANAGSLGELGLAPAAVLHIDFDEPFEGFVLADDHRKKAVPFEV